MYKPSEKLIINRPHTVQDYVIKNPGVSSKKSEKLIKPRYGENSTRFLKSVKGRQTTDLVNLINQTKKDVESLRILRRNSKNKAKLAAVAKKNNYVSPLGDRSKDDEYGFNDTKKKWWYSTKSEKAKPKKKSKKATGTSSGRKGLAKTNKINFHPRSGKITLISRNNTCASQCSNDKNHPINSRKGSHKRTSSIESSEKGDRIASAKFLVSRKYNKNMPQARRKVPKDGAKSVLTKSIKIAPSSNRTKQSYLEGTTFDAYTPTPSSTTKLNIKTTLLNKKQLGMWKKKAEIDLESKKWKRKKRPKDLRLKENPAYTLMGEHSVSPTNQTSGFSYSSLGTSHMKHRKSPDSVQALYSSLTSQKYDSNSGASSDLYRQIKQTRKEKLAAKGKAGMFGKRC